MKKVPTGYWFIIGVVVCVGAHYLIVLGVGEKPLLAWTGEKESLCPWQCEVCHVYGVSQGVEVDFYVKPENDSCTLPFSLIFPEQESDAPNENDYLYVEVVNGTQQCEGGEAPDKLTRAYCDADPGTCNQRHSIKGKSSRTCNDKWKNCFYACETRGLEIAECNCTTHEECMQQTSFYCVEWERPDCPPHETVLNGTASTACVYDVIPLPAASDECDEPHERCKNVLLPLVSRNPCVRSVITVNGTCEDAIRAYGGVCA